MKRCKKTIYEKKKYLIPFMTILLIASLFCGCASRGIKLEKNENTKEYIFTESDEWDCMQLEIDGKVYLPYCSANPAMCEEVIGYFKFISSGEEGTGYILSYKGLSSDEWIMDAITTVGDRVNGENIAMVWREQSVTTIPECIKEESSEEYVWNKDLKRE